MTHLIRLTLETFYIIAMSLIVQAAQQTWPGWAKNVEERMAQGRTALREAEDKLAHHDRVLADTQRGLQSHQMVVARLVSSLEDIPDAIEALRTKTDELLALQEEIKESIDRKNDQVEKAEPASRSLPWIAMSVCVLLIVAIILGTLLIRKVQNGKGDIPE